MVRVRVHPPRPHAGVGEEAVAADAVGAAEAAVAAAGGTADANANNRIEVAFGASHQTAELRLIGRWLRRGPRVRGGTGGEAEATAIWVLVNKPYVRELTRGLRGGARRRQWGEAKRGHVGRAGVVGCGN